METKLHKSLSFPFFLLSMVFLSGVFTLGTQFKENNLVQEVTEFILKDKKRPICYPLEN